MSTPFFTKLISPSAAGAGSNPIQAAMQSVSTISRTAQTAGIEWTDFAKQSYDHGTATFRKLAKARDPKTALAIQAEFMKGAYERFNAQAKLLGELYAGLASDLSKDLGKPAAPATAQITKA